MYKLFKIATFSFFFICSYSLMSHGTKKKRNVVVYYNKSGGGHLSAAKSIEESLSDQSFSVQKVNFSEKYLDPRNPLFLLSRGKETTDAAYSRALSTGQMTLANFASVTFAPIFIAVNHASIVAELKKEYTQDGPPDLIISTIPFVNGYLAEVAEHFEIPLIVSTQDGDVRHFVGTLKRTSYEKLHVTVGINATEVSDQFVKAGIPKNRVHRLSHPVRADFLEDDSEARARKREELRIPDDVFTLMILLGGAGGEDILRYTKEIMRETPSVYVIACVGRNEELKQRLRREVESPHLRIISFTKEIPDLLRASDLLLTKPGPNSIMEALYTGTPIVLDNGAQKLSHERANELFAVSNGYAVRFQKIQELTSLVEHYRENKNGDYSLIKDHVSRFEGGDFRVEFGSLVETFFKREE